MQVKQSKHISPLWQLPLQDLCRMLGNLGDRLHEAWGSAERDESEPGYDQSVSGTFAQMLVELHDLQNLCRVLQPREVRNNMETWSFNFQYFRQRCFYWLHPLETKCCRLKCICIIFLKYTADTPLSLIRLPCSHKTS